MKKDPPDWKADDFLDHVLIWAWIAMGAIVAFVLLFWLAAIFELVP